MYAPYGYSGTVPTVGHTGQVYAPYGYPGTVPTVGHTGQVYGSQHYQYPATYCSPPACPSAPNVSNRGPASKAKVSPSVAVNQAPTVVDNSKAKPNRSANGNPTRKVRAAAPKPGQKKISNDSHPPVFTGGQHRRANTGAISSTSAKNHTLRPLPHLKAEIPKSGTAPHTAGIWNSMYLCNQMYAHCGNALGKSIGIGPNFYGPRPNGCWGVPVDSSKYRPRGRGNEFNGYDNDNFVGLGELNRGPRIGLLKNQKGFEGIYFGEPRGFATNNTGEDIGFNTEVYSTSEAFQAAWTESCKVEASAVLVPTGYNFLAGPISFSGPYCQSDIVFQKKAPREKTEHSGGCHRQPHRHQSHDQFPPALDSEQFGL